MKTLAKLLVVAALALAASLSTPPNAAAAINWCNLCDQTGDCVPCCRCDGHGAGYCEIFCNGW